MRRCFTLLEVLIYAMLLSSLLVTLVQYTTSSCVILQKQAAQQQRILQCSYAYQRLGQLLKATVISTTKEQPVPFFDYNESEQMLSWHCSHNPCIFFNPDVIASLYLSNQELILDIWPLNFFKQTSQETQTAFRQVLLSSVESLSFELHSSSGSSKYYPDMIQVHITLKRDSAYKEQKIHWVFCVGHVIHPVPL